MDNEVAQKLALIEAKVEAIFVSVEKTRKYFFWTMIVTLVLFVLPLVGLVFAVPAFLNNYVGGIDSISGL